MLKRLLNTFTVFCTIYLVILVGVIITGGISNWVVFISSNFFPLIGAFLLIAVVNYVVYSQITVWHKNTGHNNNDN